MYKNDLNSLHLLVVGVTVVVGVIVVVVGVTVVVGVIVVVVGVTVVVV